ncbi:MAG: uroporphyrinogen decarboxylase family protein [Clostridiaceae bacterium]|nr:uroporphyrinogen decarboxylase family protein [Clostridiaceae bacterium]
MKQLNMVEWQKQCIRQGGRRPLPVLSFPGVQIIGATVGDIVRHGERQAQCMKAIADRYPTLASVSNMDLSVEAEAFGAKATFFDHDVPCIVGRLIDTPEDVEKLAIPQVGAGRTGECVKAVELAAGQINDRPVFAGVIGPFSLAGRLLEMTEIMYKALDEPDMVHQVLSKATQFLIRYISAFKAAGANGIIMAEPAAGLLSPAWNAEFSVPYVQKIIAAVQDDYFTVIYHNCGNVVPLIADLVGTGARAFHFGNAIALTDIIGQIPADRLVLGNIDPATQFAQGTPESIALAVHNLCKQMKSYPNYILSSGCDIPPRSPLANIDAFFRAAQAEGF